MTVPASSDDMTLKTSWLSNPIILDRELSILNRALKQYSYITFI